MLYPSRLGLPLCLSPFAAAAEDGKQKHIPNFGPRLAGACYKMRDEQGHLPDFSWFLGTAGGL
jgi:hypothetical protein